MWTVLKINNNSFITLKNEIFSKIGKETIFYNPKIKINKFMKSKTYTMDSYLLGDYILCYNKNFKNRNFLTAIKYCKGLKYLLSNFLNCQKDIENFIKKCKENEDDQGYIKQSFFEFEFKKNYEFISGPFSNLILNIIEQNKVFVKGFIGKYKISVSKKGNFFRPV